MGNERQKTERRIKKKQKITNSNIVPKKSAYEKKLNSGRATKRSKGLPQRETEEMKGTGQEDARLGVLNQSQVIPPRIKIRGMDSTCSQKAKK